jgi:hypothetical protein
MKVRRHLAQKKNIDSLYAKFLDLCSLMQLAAKIKQQPFPNMMPLSLAISTSHLQVY